MTTDHPGRQAIAGHVTVHVKAHCQFCRTDNELTIRHVLPSQPVTCSTCGGGIGTVGELALHPGKGEARRSRLTRA